MEKKSISEDLPNVKLYTFKLAFWISRDEKLKTLQEKFPLNLTWKVNDNVILCHPHLYSSETFNLKLKKITQETLSLSAVLSNHFLKMASKE